MFPIGPSRQAFFGALNQGAFATFFDGDSYYDSSLWTMRYEFGGSFIAFGAALALGLFRAVSKYAAAAALGVLLIFLNANGPAYSPFVIGVGLAYFLPRDVKWPPFSAYAAVALAIYLFGYSGKSLGVYGFFPLSLGGAVSNFHILASLLLISAVEHGPKGLRRLLSGRVSAFLGALSFPIYFGSCAGPLLGGFGGDRPGRTGSAGASTPRAASASPSPCRFQRSRRCRSWPSTRIGSPR